MVGMVCGSIESEDWGGLWRESIIAKDGGGGLQGCRYIIVLPGFSENVWIRTDSCEINITVL